MIRPQELADAEDRRFALIITAIFALVAAWGLFRHEPWMDEMQAWQLARSSASLGELFVAKRYEGHPDAWYLLLFAASRVWRDPVAMQVVHWAIATGVIYVVARFAPFPRLLRVLLCCGTYLAYEYAIVSRAYALGALALFCLCVLFPQWPKRALQTGILLTVLANTSVYGLMLGAAVVAAMVVDGFSSAGTRRAIGNSVWRVAIGVVLVASSAVWSVRSIRPPRDASFTGYLVTAKTTAPAGGGGWITPWRGIYAIGSVARAYMPGVLPLRTPATARPERGVREDLPALALAIAFIGWILVTLRRHPPALALFAVGSGSMVSFTYCCFIGSSRHEGNLFLVLLATMWLAGTAGERLRTRSSGVERRLWPLVLLAVAQGSLAVWQNWEDWRRPFSTGRAAAKTIVERGWRDARILASPREHAMLIASFVDRPVFNPEYGRAITYIDWGQPPRYPNPAQLEFVVDSVARADGRQIIVALSYDPPQLLLRGGRWHEVARFDDAIVPSERFRLYTVDPPRREAAR